MSSKREPGYQYQFPHTGTAAMVTILRAGQRAEFTVTGKIKEPGGSWHICNGTAIEITGDDGRTLAYLREGHGGEIAARALEPAGYPPQEGDIWRDPSGLLWFCQRKAAVTGAMGTSLALIPARQRDPGLLQEFSPKVVLEGWTLVFRASENRLEQFPPQ